MMVVAVFYLIRNLSSIDFQIQPPNFREIWRGLPLQVFNNFILSTKRNAEWFAGLSCCFFMAFHYAQQKLFWVGIFYKSQNIQMFTDKNHIFNYIIRSYNHKTFLKGKHNVFNLILTKNWFSKFICSFIFRIYFFP